jgi:hypothetical protein
MTIRRLLALVAALAVVCGLLVTLQRRRERFRHLASKYRSASRAVYTDGYDVSMQGYHADLAAKYRAAAERPWLPVEADEPPPDGLQAFWVAHEAVKQAYPGVSLDDYVAQVILDEPDEPNGPKVWAVRYRRRDNRSGMNVFVRDRVEIELHEPDRPPDPPKPETVSASEQITDS